MFKKKKKGYSAINPLVAGVPNRGWIENFVLNQNLHYLSGKLGPLPIQY